MRAQNPNIVVVKAGEPTAFQTVAAALNYATSQGLIPPEVWIDGDYSEPPLVLPSESVVRGGMVTVNAGGGGPFGTPGFAITDQDCGATIRGSGGGPIFTCEGDATISGILFQSNVLATDGAAIHAPGGALRVSNSCFLGLEAARGGAIFGGGDTTVLNCLFLSNVATMSGGAIRQEGGRLDVTDSTFVTNDAQGTATGGAIAADSAIFISILDCAFVLNEAHAGGAADFNNCTVRWYGNVDCQDNKARVGRGGAIQAKGGTLDLLASDFKHNTAVAERGGAISVEDSALVKIEHATFDGNRTTAPFGSLGNRPGAGGAISLRKVILTDLIDVIFSGNSSTSYGGAIAAWGGGSGETVKISGQSSFTGNFVEGSPAMGGAIAVTGSEVLVGLPEGGDGGIRLKITGTSFQGNHVKNTQNPPIFQRFGRGGAVYQEGNQSDSTLTGCTFSGNKAKGDGGAVACLNLSRMEINGGGMDHNEAEDDGGAIHCTSASHVILQSIQIGPENKAIENGGGVQVSALARLSCRGGVHIFQNHSRDNRGGGLSVRNGRMSIDASLGEVLIEKNTCKTDGGGIMVLSSTDIPPLVNIWPIFTSSGQVHITGNTADGRGGGIAAVKTDKKLLVFQMEGEFKIDENDAAFFVGQARPDGVFLSGVGDASGSIGLVKQSYFEAIRNSPDWAEGGGWAEMKARVFVGGAFARGLVGGLEEDFMRGGKVGPDKDGTGLVVLQEPAVDLAGQNLELRDLGILDNVRINAALLGASPSVQKCRIAGSKDTMGLFAGDSHAKVEWTRFVRNGATQARIEGCTAIIEHNNFISLNAAQIGVDLDNSSQNTVVRFNNVTGHTVPGNPQTYGVRFEHLGNPTLLLNATENYWGAWTGPNDPGTDGGTAEGPVYGGAGERIGDGIDYSPWHRTLWNIP